MRPHAGSIEDAFLIDFRSTHRPRPGRSAMISRRLLMTFSLLVVLSASSLALADTCVECHQDPKLKVQNPKLFYYYEDFQNSVHGVAELDCVDCHGGDPKSTDMKVAHNGVLDPVAYDKVPATCGQCHGQQHDTFVTSEHYQILEDDGLAPNCVTCHGAMEMDFIFVTRVKNTCSFCHNLETGTLPGVPDQADYVLNKINIMKGYRSFVNTHAADRDQVNSLDASYQDLIARWHRFELDAVEADTKVLLGDYRKAKAQAMKDRRVR